MTVQSRFGNSTRRIILVSDYDGPIVPVKQYGEGNSRRYTGSPYSTLIGVLGYLVTEGVQRDNTHYNALLAVHERHDRDQLYAHHRFVIDAHNHTGRFLHGLSVNDVNAATAEYMDRNRQKLEPSEEMRQVLRDTKIYGDGIAVSGSPTFAIKAHDKRILKPVGIGFRHHIGMDPIVENGRFVGDRTHIEVIKGESLEFIDMVRRMDYESDKVDEVLKIISPEELENTVVFGDTTFENELFKRCGYPCMVYPNARLISSAEARHYGLIIDGADYIHRFREILDFVHCVPRRTQVSGTDITVERKIVNRFDPKIVISHPKRGSGERGYRDDDTQYERLLKSKGYSLDEVSAVLQTLEDMRSISRKDELQKLDRPRRRR
ncbi:MAG: hypothetical protein HY831_04230 [Candidatus Aenigmarchaeota archaeon]|nr:hypothetical protein [Candidatus Aenigmarchaeota archaeon]